MPSKKRTISFAQAINEALSYSLKKDKNLICYGLGVTDPKGIFGTTLNLHKKFGNKRVFDVPTSENALTGVAIGAALNGVRSVATHQRLDFFLLAMDQLVNAAAKWHYMFGSQISVPITIRLIVGRGWGQGPTHSQNLQAWFNHIPGLKVVMPTHPEDAKSLLIESIFDPNPVIFLEHRWLHNINGNIRNSLLKKKIGKSKVSIPGKDITIVSTSYLTIESMKASNYLKKNFNINPEVIDLISIKPMDYGTIFKSLKKTGKILVLDTGVHINSVASEIISKIASKKFDYLKIAPDYLAMPDVPEPTGFSLTKKFHISQKEIVLKILEMLKIKVNKKKIISDLQSKTKFHDQPDFGLIEPF